MPQFMTAQRWGGRAAGRWGGRALGGMDDTPQEKALDTGDTSKD